MTDTQLSTSIRAYSRRRPFREYTIEFNNGEQIRITHPEGIGPFAGVWLYVDPRGPQIVFASTSVCRVLDRLDT